MERALREELNSIGAIQNKIHPTNAPEDVLPPYLVYTANNYSQIKTFEGYQNNMSESYLIKVFSKSYSDMRVISDSVRDKIMTFPGRTIQDIHFEDIEVNNIGVVWAEPVKLYCSIIDIKFYYKEE